MTPPTTLQVSAIEFHVSFKTFYYLPLYGDLRRIGGVMTPPYDVVYNKLTRAILRAGRRDL